MSFALSGVILAGCGGAPQKGVSKEQRTQKIESNQEAVKEETKEKDSKVVVLTGKIEGTINISIMESDPFLEDAVKKFEKKYPGVRVNINNFSNPIITEMPNGAVMGESDPDPNKSFDKYVTTLNTTFMNGQGDDIINTSGLPIDKYIGSGYIEDMKPYLNKENGFIPEDYHMNIIDTMQYKKGIYNIPINYNLSLISVNSHMLDKAVIDKKSFKDDVWTLSRMKELYKAVREKIGTNIYLTDESGGGLFYRLFNVNGYKWINVPEKKVSLDSREFIGLLEECKKLEKDGWLLDSKEKPTADVYKNSLFLVMNTLSPMIYNGDYYESEAKQVDYRVFTDEEKQVNVGTYQNFAINASSPNKYAAFEFIKFLLSEEMQVNPGVTLPLNKKAFEIQAKQIISEMVKEMPEWGDEVKAPEKDILQDYITHINEWSEQVSQYNPISAEIMEVVYEEASDFFKGDKTSEEVAKNAQNKIYMMLNE
jgi:multiple sugar transport system substrate-binding protein